MTSTYFVHASAVDLTAGPLNENEPLLPILKVASSTRSLLLSRLTPKPAQLPLLVSHCTASAIKLLGSATPLLLFSWAAIASLSIPTRISLELPEFRMASAAAL